MELSDKLKVEFDQRAKLADDTGNLTPGQSYAWSLAVIHLSYVSDYDGFVGLLKEHVDLLEKHTQKTVHSLPDVVVEGSKPDELYVFMNGPKLDAVLTLDDFFESIERLYPGEWTVGARLGASEYISKSTAESMIDSARKRPTRHEIGKGPGVYSKPLTGGLESVA